jgi:hypothetical protein
MFNGVFDWTDESWHTSTEKVTVQPGDVLTSSVFIDAANPKKYYMKIASKNTGKTITTPYTLEARQSAEETTAYVVMFFPFISTEYGTVMTEFYAYFTLYYYKKFEIIFLDILSWSMPPTRAPPTLPTASARSRTSISLSTAPPSRQNGPLSSSSRSAIRLPPLSMPRRLNLPGRR